MSEHQRSGELAILVHIHFTAASQNESDPQEFQELALAAGANPCTLISGTRAKPDPKYFVGSGKAQEIQQAVSHFGAQIVIFDHALSPSQERNLERLVKCRVIDRRGLILDIFARRARTFEGKLQVEMAQLQHLSTRLVRGWTHLERQKGGIGLRGPGETQLETDRRLVRQRIHTLEKRLEKVRSQRDQNRQARLRAAIPTVALVGYTNAGKSTLFNALTQAGTFTADQLFATLDPTLRRVQWSGAPPIILADTVGFIRDLPHDLVDAFRATLEETRQADLLIHVVDAHSEQRQEQIQQVTQVLAEIGANGVQCLQVYNKIDLIPGCKPRMEWTEEDKVKRVWISAVTEEGMPLLQEAIASLLQQGASVRQICLRPGQGQLRAHLYQLGVVAAEECDQEGNFHLAIRVTEDEFKRLLT